MKLFKKNERVKGKTQRYIGVLLRSENGLPIKVAEQEMNIDDKEIHFKGIKESGTFVFDKLSILYRDRNINYMFFSMDGRGAITTWNKNEYPNGISIKDLDVLVRQNIVVGFLALVKGAFEKKDITGKLAGYIVVGVMGGALGYIASETMRQSVPALLLMIGGI